MMASSACSLESSPLYCCSILYAIDAHRETIAPVVIQSRDSNGTLPYNRGTATDCHRKSLEY